MSVPGAIRRGRPLGVVGGQPVPIRADAGHRGKKEDQMRVRFIRLNRFPEIAVLVQYTSSTPTDAGQREKNRSQSRTVEPGLMFAIVTFVRTDVTPPGAVLCGTWFLQ